MTPTSHPNDTPEYPGATMRARELRRQYPQLSTRQAHSMACIEISPDRNGGARLIGFDRLDRPVYERDAIWRYDHTHRFAHSRGGEPIDVAEPIRPLETP